MKPGLASRIATAIRTQGLEGPVIVNIIGLAVAYSAPTPKNISDSVVDFWIRNVAPNANAVISEIAEHLVFNPQLAVAVAKEAYVSRVRAFFTPTAGGAVAVAEWDPLTKQAFQQTHTAIAEHFGLIIPTDTGVE